MKKKILVNFVYWQPVGHAVEALRYTLGYHGANPDAEINLVLNKHTAVELAYLCPWLKNVYTIDLPNARIKVTNKLYSHIPRQWDGVAYDERSDTKKYCQGSFFDYYRQTEKYFVAPNKEQAGDNKEIAYKGNTTLRLHLPQENLAFAQTKMLNTKVKIAILPAGGKKSQYFPSVNSWKLIIDVLFEKFPDLSIYLLGKINQDLRTSSGISRRKLDTLLKSHTNLVDCFDIGLLNQMAVIQNCNLFISPHSGFGFAVLAVGTPWLTLSGGRWPEYFYNDVPFYSVLPNKKYPVYENKNFAETITTPEDGKRILCMSRERIQEDLPEIVKVADILINKKWDYQTCLKNHFQKMVDFYGDPMKVYSFDQIHTQFVK